MAIVTACGEAIALNNEAAASSVSGCAANRPSAPAWKLGHLIAVDIGWVVAGIRRRPGDVEVVGVMKDAYSALILACWNVDSTGR